MNGKLNEDELKTMKELVKSTNIDIKNAKKGILNKLFSFITLFSIITLLGYLNISTNSEKGYLLMIYSGITPIITLVLAFLFGKSEESDRAIDMYPLIIGTTVYALPALMSTNTWGISSLLMAYIPSFIGVILGVKFRYIKYSAISNLKVKEAIRENENM